MVSKSHSVHFPVDSVDVVVDRPTELRLEVTKAEIRDTRRVTGKSIHFERNMTAPVTWLVLTVGFESKLLTLEVTF